MSARSSSVRVSILGDASGLNHATQEASEHVERFSEKTKESFEHIHEAGKLLAEIGGLTALTFGLKDVTEEAVKAEAEQKKLANTVKDAGLSWRAHSKEIDEWLDKTSRASGFAKSDLSAALGNFVRTTGSVTEAQKLSNDAMDLARSKGVGLANAQSILARVYNGSYTGLKRLGISVKPVTDAQDALAKSTTKATAEQKAHAKELDNQATRTKALGLVQEKFGGQSEAFAKSTAGSFDRAKQSLNLFEEQVGSVVLPLMAKAANGISSAADVAARDWPQVKATIQKAMTAIGPTVTTATHAVVTGFGAAKQGVTTAVSAISGWLSRNRAEIQAYGRDAVAGFNAARQAVATALGAVEGWLSKNQTQIKQFGKAWQNVFNDVKAIVKVAITNAVVPAFNFLLDVTKRVWPAVQMIVEGALKALNGVIKVFTGVFTGDWGKAWDGLGDIAGGVLQEVLGMFRAFTAPVREIAARIGSAIVDGLKSGLSKIGDVVSGAIDTVKNAFSSATGFAASVGDSLRNWINANTLFGDKIDLGPVHVRIPALATGGMIVGGSDKRDGTLIAASGGETVFTYDGQRIINTVGAAAGVPNLVELALSNQLPHFAAGGIVPGSYSAGYDVGVQGGSLASFFHDVITKSMLGEPHKHKTTAQAGGGSAPGDAPSAVRAMVTRANAMAGRHLPYLYGGGHGAFSTGLAGYDCSGYVSNVLGPSVLSSPMAVRQPLQGALLAGPGKWVTVGIRGTSGMNAHTMVKIGSSYYESGGGHGPARVGGWDGAFDFFHPKGYRAGGRVPGLIRQLAGASRTAVKGLLQKLSGAISSEGVSQSELFAAQSAISAAMARVRAGGVSTGERAGYRGLKGTLSLVQGEQGRRIGVSVGSIDALTQQISDDADTLDLNDQIAGVDAGSAQGLSNQLADENAALAKLQAKRTQLKKTLKTAKKTKSKTTVTKVSAAIKGLDKSILQTRAGIATNQRSLAAGDFGDAGPTQQDYFDAQLATAQLTAGTGDDLDVLNREKAFDQDRLFDAQQNGDPRLISAAAQALKGVQDSIDQLTDATNQAAALQQQHDALNQEVVENQKKILALADQGDALKTAVLALFNGGIGGRVGLASQSPAYAGQLSRY